MAYEYFIDFKSLLIEDEMNKSLNALFSSKKIDNIRLSSLKSLFEELSDPLYRGGTVHDEQFNRIFETWLNLEATIHLKKILEEGYAKINEGNGIIAADFMSNKFRDIHRADVVVSPVSHLDAFNDTEIQMKDLIDRMESKEEDRSLSTGIKSVDKYFSGFEPGTLTAIGAPVGNCKSTLMLNLSRNQAMAGKNVLVVTMEMPEMQWVRKLNSSSTHIEYTDMLIGNKSKISDGVVGNFKEFLDKRSNGEGGYKIVFIPAEVYTWEQIVEEIDKKYPDYNPDIIYIDQLSLINLSKYGGSGQRRDIALGDLAKDIRSYAQVRRVPICIAVQVNRAAIKFDPKGERKIDINIENLEDSNKVAAHLDNFFGIHKMQDDRLLSFKIIKQREGESDKTIILHMRLEVCHIGDEDDMVKVVFSNVNEEIMKFAENSVVAEEIEELEVKQLSMNDSLEELMGFDEVKHESLENEKIKDEKVSEDILEEYDLSDVDSVEGIAEVAHRGAVKEESPRSKMSDLINNSFSSKQKDELKEIISGEVNSVGFEE